MQTDVCLPEQIVSSPSSLKKSNAFLAVPVDCFPFWLPVILFSSSHVRTDLVGEIGLTGVDCTGVPTRTLLSLPTKGFIGVLSLVLAVEEEEVTFSTTPSSSQVDLTGERISVSSVTAFSLKDFLKDGGRWDGFNISVSHKVSKYSETKSSLVVILLWPNGSGNAASGTPDVC